MIDKKDIKVLFSNDDFDRVITDYGLKHGDVKLMQIVIKYLFDRYIELSGDSISDVKRDLLNYLENL